MKTNKGFVFVLVIILLVVIAGFVGYTIARKTTASSQKISPQMFYKQGKLFDFIDKFTWQRDMGVPSTLIVKPESGIIVFSYPTSQETGSEGVYNYKTDEIFTGLGSSDYVSSDYTVAVLGDDKLLNLVRNWEEENPPVGHLMIKDFKNNVIAEVKNTDTEFKFFHEAYAYNDGDGYTLITFEDTPEFVPGTTKYKTYKLNETNFQLSEYNINMKTK